MARYSAEAVTPGAQPALSKLALRTRAKAARKRSRRAAAQQETLVQHIAQALDDHALAEQPLLPTWLSVLLSGVLVGLLYLAWQLPG